MARPSRLGIVMGVMAGFAVILTAGCGHNTMAPAMPDGQALQTGESGAEVWTLDENSGMVTANCRRVRANQGWTERFMRRLSRFFSRLPVVQKVYRRVFTRYVTDPDAQAALKRVLRARLTRLVVVRFGVGPLLIKDSLKILTQAWLPGSQTSPNGFDPELTLIPYDFHFRRGFYGAMHEGWGNGNGYHFQSFNADQDQARLTTHTLPVNMYQNETGVITWSWRYAYTPSVYDPSADRVPKYIHLSFQNRYYNNNISFGGDTFWDIDANRIHVQEAWASTSDKSGRLSIFSTDGRLNADLTFAADGSGGGTMDVEDFWGRIHHYEITQWANGHGYYIKDGGRKRRF